MSLMVTNPDPQEKTPKKPEPNIKLHFILILLKYNTKVTFMKHPNQLKMSRLKFMNDLKKSTFNFLSMTNF